MANIYDMADTWNDGLTAFTAIKMNVTDTASASGSLLMDLQVGGATRLAVTKSGALTIRSGGVTTGGSIDPAGGKLTFTTYADPLDFIPRRSAHANPKASIGWVVRQGLTLASDMPLNWVNSINSSTGTVDTILARDAANTLALRRSTNAQTFNIYNTYTDGSNYERGFMKWNSNVLEIGTGAAGTGTVRTLKLTTGWLPTVELRPTNLFLKGANAEMTLDNSIYINTYTYTYLRYRNNERVRIGGNEVIFYTTSIFQANVDMTALPTSDPAVAGRLWNNADVLQVSSGSASSEVVRSNATQGGTGSTTVNNIVTITQANYDAIVTPDATTLYVITG